MSKYVYTCVCVHICICTHHQSLSEMSGSIHFCRNRCVDEDGNDADDAAKE